MEQTAVLESPGKKTLKAILREGLVDIIGFDRGVLRTFVDLVRQPDKVIKSYHQNDPMYTRPVAFIMVAAGLFLLISNFAVNWEQVFDGFVKEIFALKGATPDPEKLGEMQGMIELYVNAFFGKYIVVAYILISFTRAASFVRIAKDASFANMLVIMFYRNGSSLMLQASFLFVMLLLQNVYGFILWLTLSSVVDQYLFRNYIDKTLGHGARRPFVKRLLLVIAVVFGLSILVQLILEHFGIK